MPASTITALLIAGSSSQAQVGAGIVQIGPDGIVRVRDLADTAVGADLGIMSVRHGQTLSAAQQRQAVRNRLPGARFSLRQRQAIRFAIAIAPPHPQAEGCSAAATLISAGRVVSAADLAPHPCAGAKKGNWLRSIPGGYQARVDIPAGTPLGRPTVRPNAAIAVATPVVLRTIVGPVIIERQAETLQPTRVGRPVFARTTDGTVVVAPTAIEPAKDDR